MDRRAVNATLENEPKMKQVLAICAITLSGFSLAAQASDGTETPKNEIEVRGFAKGDSTVKAYFEKAITDTVSLNLTAFKTRGWDAATVGPTFHISPAMSLGIGLGTSRYMANDERSKSSHATASLFWFWKTDAWEAEVLVERYSRDPKPWYQEGYAQKRIGNGFAAGVFAKKDTGWGPRLSYRITENINVWVAPLVKKSGNTTAILGGVVSF